MLLEFFLEKESCVKYIVSKREKGRWHIEWKKMRHKLSLC